MEKSLSKKSKVLEDYVNKKADFPTSYFGPDESVLSSLPDYGKSNAALPRGEDPSILPYQQIKAKETIMSKRELAKIAREIKSIKAELNKESFGSGEGWYYAEEISRVSSRKDFKACLEDWSYRWMNETGDQDMKGWVQKEWKPFQKWAVQKAQELYSTAAASWKANGNTGMWSDGYARQEALMAVLSGKPAYDKAMKNAKGTGSLAMKYGEVFGGKSALKRDRMFSYDEFALGQTDFPRVKGVKFSSLNKSAGDIEEIIEEIIEEVEMDVYDFLGKAVKTIDGASTGTEMDWEDGSMEVQGILYDVVLDNKSATKLLKDFEKEMKRKSWFKEHNRDAQFKFEINSTRNSTSLWIYV